MSDESAGASEPGKRGSWADKFSKKLHAKQQARLEMRRDFGAYQEAVAVLFESIAEKVGGVEEIQVQRPMGLRTEALQNVTGKVDTIKALTMRCDGKTIELLPEGINFEIGKGRIRIVHKIKALPDYLFLYLVVDPTSDEQYPRNLHWVVNDTEGQKPEDFPVFDDERLESLIEAAFLAEE